MAQNKKTGEFQVEDLPDLTPMQSKFVEGLLAGKTASDAYRAAYSTENMQEASIWALASRLRHDVKIASWLTAARMAKLGTAKVTFDDHQQELERLREISVKTGNLGAAVQAELARGKASGHYVDKIDVTRREADPVSTLRQIATHSPDLARELAAANNIPWQDIDADNRATKH
jgi:phage terminase small subunit